MKKLLLLAVIIIVIFAAYGRNGIIGNSVATQEEQVTPIIQESIDEPPTIYDSLRYPGTSDNASGTALLMENAQRMQNQDNYYTLKYVFLEPMKLGCLVVFIFTNPLHRKSATQFYYLSKRTYYLKGQI